MRGLGYQGTYLPAAEPFILPIVCLRKKRVHRRLKRGMHWPHETNDLQSHRNFAIFEHLRDGDEPQSPTIAMINQLASHSIANIQCSQKHYPDPEPGSCVPRAAFKLMLEPKETHKLRVLPHIAHTSVYRRQWGRLATATCCGDGTCKLIHATKSKRKETVDAAKILRRWVLLMVVEFLF